MDVKTGRNQDKPAHVLSRRAYYDELAARIRISGNRAVAVPCYAPTHTFVEKLQTISTKYRRLGESAAFPGNFLRHYYDVYCLLGLEEVQAFMREPAYQERKAQRFRSGDEQVIARNQAFVLAEATQRERFAFEYRKTQALYYQGQPDSDALVARIHEYIDVM
ncbi:MAG: nucleotidyl transferase AbiEii/AbiGii toxin family protein [Pigmentiphaga sp.]